MGNIPTFTTAKAFNDASKESDWGYVIVPDGDRWKLTKTDGTFICEAEEHWAILIGKMLVEVNEHISG